MAYLQQRYEVVEARLGVVVSESIVGMAQGNLHVQTTSTRAGVQVGIKQHSLKITFSEIEDEVICGRWIKETEIEN